MALPVIQYLFVIQPFRGDGRTGFNVEQRARNEESEANGIRERELNYA